MIPLNLHEIHAVVRKHLSTLHEFYGPEKGIFYARKHVTWYLQHLAETARTSNEFSIAARKRFNAITQCSDQLEVIDSIFFSSLKKTTAKTTIEGDGSMSNFLNGSEHCPNENSQHTSETGSGQVQDQQKQTIRECVAASLTDYFEKVDHENISELYELVLSEVEAPLLENCHAPYPQQPE